MSRAETPPFPFASTRFNCCPMHGIYGHDKMLCCSNELAVVTWGYLITPSRIAPATDGGSLPPQPFYYDISMTCVPTRSGLSHAQNPLEALWKQATASRTCGHSATREVSRPDPASSGRSLDRRHSSGPKTLAPRPKSGNFSMKRQTSWGMSVYDNF